jgi:hypothetical protein
MNWSVGSYSTLTTRCVVRLFISSEENMMISPFWIVSGTMGRTITTLPVCIAGSILPEMTTSVLQPKKGETMVNNDPEIIKIRSRIAATLPTRFV